MKRRHLLFAVTLLLSWTTFLAFMFHRETALDESRRRGIALSQARALFNQLSDMRAWNDSHDGVYVPITEKTPPNPYIDNPERDVTTLSGRRLTLLNHAYMTRQLAQVMRERRGIALHMTSRSPLRPGNDPDPWERAALETFERGVSEQVTFARNADGQEIFRYIAPLRAEESCLPCHARQQHRLGEVLGGLSIGYSAEHLVSSRQAFRQNILFTSLVLWLLGAGLITAVTKAYHQKSRLVAQLHALVLVDELTGLHNRRGFTVLAEKQLQIARRIGRPDLLLFIDLDSMKRINDEHGHNAGDAALRRVAAVLRAAFRTSDIIARFGGDEFVVLCPDTGSESAATLLESLERHVEDINAGAADAGRLSLSVGTMAFDPVKPATLDELLQAADAAMYQAKRHVR